MSFTIRKSSLGKIVPIVIIWITLSALFYTGILSVNLPGHIEMSIIVAFAVVLLGLELFSIIKKTAYQHL